MYKFKFKTFSEKTESFEEVIHQLINLEKELKGSDMRDLVAFNHTYLIITENVYAKLTDNNFQYPSTFKKLDINFARYYFEALKMWVSGKQLTPAWSALFTLCGRGAFQFIYMALGVNAHVNNDLPQSLQQTVGDNYGFRSDYDKVNDVIDASMAEIIDSLNEDSKALSDSQNIFRPIYSEYLSRLIRNWRGKAWENFLSLKENKIKKTELEKISMKIATKLTQIEEPSDFYKIFDRNLFN